MPSRVAHFLRLSPEAWEMHTLPASWSAARRGRGGDRNRGEDRHLIL
jgi:hypothetical protein